MTVALLPSFHPYTPWLPAHEPLDAAPDYVRSRAATRWHRPRAGFRHHSGNIVYEYWCGASTGHGGMGVDDVPADDPVCATCEGRFTAQQQNRYVFTPQKALPPRQCPASRSWYWVPGWYRRGQFDCLVCGASVSARASWNSDARVKPHAPGPGLVEPCRLHGWAHLVLADDAVVCRCTVDEAVAS